MATFICCADESADSQRQHEFWYGGFAATVQTWEQDFLPAWDARVLAGPPRLEYLHVSEWMRHSWRRANKLTWGDIDKRLTAAAQVIRSTGGLIPFVWSLDLDRFSREVLPFAPRKRHSALEQPDYLTFLAVNYSVLVWLRSFRPDVERVDFWVEKNGKISTRIGRLHDRVTENLIELGRPDLAALVGGFTAVEKWCVQAQAADMLCWHERNAQANTLDREGWRNRWRMIGDREGFRASVDKVIFDEFVPLLARHAQSGEWPAV
jgi:hypothetical protein